MSRRFSFFGKRVSSARSTGGKVARPTRQFSFENLEERRLMTISPALGAGFGPVAPTKFGQPTSEGSITFDGSLGKMIANGSATLPERVAITIDNRGTASTADDLVVVSIYNSGLPVQLSVLASSVKEVDITVGNGDNYIDNQTAVSMNVHTGNGNNTILGGSGSDYLMGGNGNDYIDGRGGDDMIYGLGGNDALFGDDGDDTILGGNGDDVIFGGNGVDHLYGEAGNDHLYGGAGTDALTDSTGTNNLYTDYGPDGVVSNSGYQSFDFFDRYLKDPTVRSQVRLQYADGSLNRADMLQLYTTIEADKTVSSNEFSDLKNLVSPKLVMPNDTRFFATKVANGDAANAHYQGTTLGNLKAGSTGVQLNELVGKWFEGNDLPSVAGVEPVGFAPTYQFAGGQLFQHPATYTDVAQGDVGNCGFMAALASVAKTSPQFISNMFVDNGDGTYTVRFYNGSTPAYVTVNRELPTDIVGKSVFSGWSGIDSQGNYDDTARNFESTNTLWVALAEKAYAQLNESGWIGLDGTNTYAALNGVYPNKAQAQISGYTAAVHKISTSSTLTDLVNSLNANKAITITSNTTESDGNPVDHNHAYVVTSYDGATHLFTLYNPWGYENTQATINPTILHLSLADMTHSFASWTEDSVM